jgi:hypothetical protein
MPPPSGNGRNYERRQKQPFSAALPLSTALASSFGTAAAWLFAGHDSSDDRGGAANSGFDSYRAKRAVIFTGTTFHAGIPFGDPGFSIVHGENPVGTDVGAHAAAGAFFFCKLQCNNVFQIFMFHMDSSLKSTHLAVSRFRRRD